MTGTLDLGTKADGAPLRVPVAAFDYHAQVIGPTGYGKSYFLYRLFQELVRQTDSAVVFIDPGGDAYDFLKRWCYQKSLDRRMILLDPSERRMICGFNPVSRRSQGLSNQAGSALDNIRRAMGSQLFANAPMTAQWMFNLLYTLLETGLTLNEAPDILDYKPSPLRDAVIAELEDSDIKRDWLWLDEQVAMSRNTQAAKIVQEQLGSSYRRVRQYVRNDNLRLMLATSTRAISWKDVLDQRKIVLVNLARGDNVLSDDDQRLLGIQIVSELINETFRRQKGGGEARVPCYLIVDEFSRFASGEVAQVLTEGRKYLLRLILAHQNLKQLAKVMDEDPVLYDAVMSCARTKIVFGGLPPHDADELGRTLYGHHLDPDKRKLELWSWIQLSRVERVEIRSRGWSSGSSTGRGTGDGSSSTLPDVGFHPTTTLSNTVQRSFQSMDAQQETITDALMTMPGDPQQQLSSVQFENLEEQLYRHVKRMVARPEREAIIAISKDEPIEFRVANVDEPRIGAIQGAALDLRLMRALSCYSEPQAIEQEIEQRRTALLARASLPSQVCEAHRPRSGGRMVPPPPVQPRGATVAKAQGAPGSPRTRTTSTRRRPKEEAE